MVRLGVPEDQPLAVQQWQGLIAINYPARAYGLSRHVTITEAQKACPQIIMQHVATWKEGDEKWAYHDDAFKQIHTHKVSLDPYRLQSRRILKCIKDTLLPPPVQRVEKASIDEVFLDLSAQVHGLLLERYPELRGPAPYDDPTEQLPAPPTTALDWTADALVDLDAKETEEDAPDWDDVAMLLGSEIVRGVRDAVRKELQYTCSAGVARNKMIAKLGSGHKKPNQQTIVRNRAVNQFLSEFKFTKIRNLGGKLGDEVVSTFNTDSVGELLEVPLEQLKKKLGDDTGMWLHQIIRGEDHSEVNSRTQIKSMLSAKSFRPSINTMDQAVKWLRIFVADIFSRLVEEGVLENKRRPKTVNLHHRQGGQMRSKQAPIPQGRPIDETILFDLAKGLLAQVIVDGRAWPCANLSLSVGGFEDGVTNNKGIGGFLVKGDEAKMLQSTTRPADVGSPLPEGQPQQKKRRVEDARINHFFARQDTSHDSENDPVDFEDVPSAQFAGTKTAARPQTFSPFHEEGYEEGLKASEQDVPYSSPTSPDEKHVESSPMLHQSNLEKFFCERCNKSLTVDQQEEHGDWHFAQDLADQDQATAATMSAKTVKARPQTPQPKGPKGRGRPRGGGTLATTEKGQSTLAFGR